MNATYHTPALLNETIELLNINPNGIYVDLTFGGGGHSSAILQKLTTGKLIAFDRDSDAAANMLTDSRFIFIRNNFRFLRNLLRYNGINEVDGILADLGVSSHHFDTGERGFSFRFDADMDMRMTREADLTAQHVVNTYSLQQLQQLFSLYGELDNAGRLAKAIVKAREAAEIRSTQQFTDIVSVCIPQRAEHKYLAKIFQALRIEVNREMQALSQMLPQTLKVLKTSGRLAVITYHSLEDRMVKNFMKTGNIEGKAQKDFYGNIITPFDIITRKAVVPTDNEVEQNNRARSAKLRVAEKR